MSRPDGGRATGRMPKVTFVALNYAPSLGGAQELIRNIAERLVSRGVQVEVLTSDAIRSPTSRDPGRIEGDRDAIAGVEVRRFRRRPLVERLVRPLRIAWWRVQERVRPHRGEGIGPVLWGPWCAGMSEAVRRATRSSDVVVGCSAPFSTMVLPTWVGRGGRARIVTMPLLHEDPSVLPRSISRALQRSDAVVAMTTHEAAVLATAAVSPGRVRVISPGTDADVADLTPAAAREQLRLPERPTVGFIGRLAAYKGVDTLIDAAPAIWAAHPATTVLLAGSPSGWDGFQPAEVVEAGGDRFVVRERFTDEERQLLLLACDLVVHPSRQESFGLIAIEAWAARRPVVLADIPAVRSFVEPGRTGELVPPDDPAALAVLIGELLDDPARRDRLAAAGRAEVETAFDWEHIADRWYELVVGRELETI